jgi:hypothetical protein
MKALVQRLGLLSRKAEADDQPEDRYEVRLARMVRPSDLHAPKALVFKTSH